jgi:DHA3 family macrolide efflux protein-like MFS transporter
MLGALLIEFLPLHKVLAVDLVTAALAILPLFFIQIPQPRVESSKFEQKSTVWVDMRSGFRYVWKWVGLRYVIFLAVVVNLVTMPAITLLPLLVKDEFSGGAIQIASMQSSWAVGFLVGGVLLSVWGGFRRKITTVILGMFGAATGMLIVGLAHQVAFQMAMAGIFTAGLMNVLMNGPAFALLQTVVAADMQGRVLSLVISLANAMTPIGLALAGPLAEKSGVNSLFILASLVFTSGAIFILINPDIRNIEKIHDEKAFERDSTIPAIGST